MNNFRTRQLKPRVEGTRCERRKSRGLRKLRGEIGAGAHDLRVLALPRGDAGFVGVRPRMRDLVVAIARSLRIRATHDRGQHGKLRVTTRVRDFAERRVQRGRARMNVDRLGELAVGDRGLVLTDAGEEVLVDLACDRAHGGWLSGWVGWGIR